MNKAMELVFDIVKLQFDVPSKFNESRFIYGDKIEEDWLTYSKLKKRYSFSNRIHFGLIEFKGKTFFIVTGLDSLSVAPLGLTEIELNAGLFTAVVYEFELPIEKNISNTYLEEFILAQHIDSDDYTGHDFNDLIKIFPYIFIAEIGIDFWGDPENLEQIASYYLAHNKDFLPLRFSEDTRESLIELISTNSTILSYESILQALLSAQFKFAFLDLYRCVELLFQVVYVDELHSSLSLSISKSELLESIDKKLIWKPNERNTVQKIIDNTPPTYLFEFVNAIKDFDNKIINYGNWFYDLRCSIVHLKSIHKTFELKDKNWDKMILGLVHLLTYWYQKYPNFN